MNEGISKPEFDPRIPQEYRHLWLPFRTDEILYHNTTRQGLESMENMGYLEPRDPSPRNWAGMKAIFMASPSDPLYEDSLRHVLAHVRQKGDNVLRLRIATDAALYKSVDPERTFQVMSLDPIPFEKVVSIEELDPAQIEKLLEGFKHE